MIAIGGEVGALLGSIKDQRDDFICLKTAQRNTAEERETEKERPEVLILARAMEKMA